MGLGQHDVWGHLAPMFHLVDVFAVYAVTLAGGRHVTLPTFTPQAALLAIGERRRRHAGGQGGARRQNLSRLQSFHSAPMLTP